MTLLRSVCQLVCFVGLFGCPGARVCTCVDSYCSEFICLLAHHLLSSFKFVQWMCPFALSRVVVPWLCLCLFVCRVGHAMRFKPPATHLHQLCKKHIMQGGRVTTEQNWRVDTFGHRAERFDA